MMDRARKPKFFAAFLFAFTLLIYAAVVPLGQGGESTVTPQTTAKNAHPLERVARTVRVATDGVLGDPEDL